MKQKLKHIGKLALILLISFSVSSVVASTTYNETEILESDTIECVVSQGQTINNIKLFVNRQTSSKELAHLKKINYRFNKIAFKQTNGKQLLILYQNLKIPFSGLN